MLNKQDINNWQATLGKEEWNRITKHWNLLTKTTITQTICLKNEEKLQELENAILQLEDSNIRHEDLKINNKESAGFIDTYNIQFFSKYRNGNFNILFKLLPNLKTFFKQELSIFQINDDQIYFNIIRKTSNAIIFISFEKLKKDFCIKLPSIRNKNKLKYFDNIFEIEDYINNETGFKKVINKMNIQVYYKNIHLGKLNNCPSISQSREYSFYLNPINSTSLKYLKINSQNEEDFLSEFIIYKINNLNNDVIIIFDDSRYYFTSISDYYLNNSQHLISHLINEYPEQMY